MKRARSTRRSSTISQQSELADHFESLSVSPCETPRSIRKSARVSSRNSSANVTPSQTRAKVIPARQSQRERDSKSASDFEDHLVKVTKDKRGNLQKTMSMRTRSQEKLATETSSEALPGREQEFELICDKISDALHTRQDISGVPGTGKTATLKQSIRYLRKPEQKRRVGKFEFVEINGMKLSDVSQTYSILWQHISGKSLSGTSALRRLTEYFEKPRNSSVYNSNSIAADPISHRVVLLDELDLLLKKKSTILYHFFEWTGWKTANLIVIAIANTMDLPERFLPNRIASRMGTNRINFKPYTYPQLMAIINHRQKDWQSRFHPDALEYCARKVSAVSGDARRALSLAKRAVEWLGSDTGTKGTLITIPLMEQAIQMTFAGNPVQMMTDLSMQQKALLLATLLASRTTGSAILPFEKVCEHHWQLLRANNMGKITFPTLQSMCAQLESLRLMGRQDDDLRSSITAASRVRLCVPEEEVGLALKSVAAFQKHLQV